MGAAPDSVVNLAEKFAKVDEHWSPRIVGQLNDLHVKVVKLQGEFVWHQHDDTDEFFLVVTGHMTIQLEGRPDATLGPGEFFVVPAGVRHRPVADVECEVVLLEPAGTVNTGDAESSDLTADPDWV